MRNGLEVDLRKRTNKWAIALYVLAGLYALGQAIAVLAIDRQLGPTLGVQDWARITGDILRPLFFQGGMLVGLGVLIEMVDRVRWRSLSAEERAQEKSKRGGLWRRRRDWPHATSA